MATIPNGQSNTFEGGLDKDTAPELLPKNKYRDSQNLRLISVDGNKYKLENIRGNVGYFEIPDIDKKSGKAQIIQIKLIKIRDFLGGFGHLIFKLNNNPGQITTLKNDETLSTWYINLQKDTNNNVFLPGFSSVIKTIEGDEVVEITHISFKPFDFSFILGFSGSDPDVIIETKIIQRAVPDLATQIDEQFTIIGMVNVGNGICVFSTNRKFNDSTDTGNQIGLVDENGKYKMIVASPELNFSMDAHIEGRFRIKFGNHRLVYFRDKFNSLRVVDIDDEIWADLNPGFINERMNIFKTIDIPTIDYNKFIVGGAVLTGGYVFAIRYITYSLTNTKFLATTNLIELVSKLDENDGMYRGDPDNTLSNKSIVLDIKGIDLDYKFFEVAVCKALSGGGGNFACKIFLRQEINSKEVQIIYTGNEVGEVINQSDISLLGVNFDNVGSEEILKDRLFVANVKRDSVLLDWDLSGINIGFTIKDHGDLKGGEVEKRDYFEKGYFPDEFYAFTIVPFDLNGNLMFAIPIGDKINSLGAKLIKIPSLFEFESAPFGKIGDAHRIVGGSPDRGPIERFGSVGISLSNIFIPDSIKTKISGFAVYRAVRDDLNKTILGYGVMDETYFAAKGVTDGREGFYLDSLDIVGAINTIHPFLFTFDCPEFIINGYPGFIEGDQIKPQMLFNLFKRFDSEGNIFYQYFAPREQVDKIIKILISAFVFAGDQVGLPGVNFFNVGRSNSGGGGGHTLAQSKGCRTVIFQLEKELFPSSNSLPNGADTLNYETIVAGSLTISKAINFLAAYIRPNPQQYGRPENIVYHPTGHFFKVNPDTPNSIPTQIIFGGDCFAGNFFYRKLIRPYDDPKFTGTATRGQLRQFPILSSINLEIIHSETGNFPNTQADSMSFAGGANDNRDNNLLYNSAYSAHNTLQFSKIKPKDIDKTKEITKFPNAIFYSDSDISQSLVDRFRVFLPNNFQDRYSELGAITHLEALSNDIVCFHERGLRRLNVYREVVSPGDEFSFKIGSGEVLSRESTVISNLYGCQNKKAIAKSQGWIYFPDCLAGKVFRTNGQTLETISDKNMKGFFEEAGLENIAGIEEVMYGYFDFKYGEYVLTTNFFGGKKIQARLILEKGKNLEIHFYNPSEDILKIPSNTKKLILKNSTYLDNIYTILEIKPLHISLADKLGKENFIEEGIYFIPENPKTISFNELTGTWETVFTYHPFLTYSDTDKVITVPMRNEFTQLFADNQILKQNKAWLHDIDKTRYNKFYGKIESDNSFVEYFLNENNKLTKVLSAIFLDMNDLWDRYTFESNQLRKFDGTLYKLISRLLRIDGTFSFRGGKFQSSIPKDKSGAKIRGEQVKIKITTNSSEYREILESMITYRPSKKNH